jgi:UDP-N-acetylmuramate-alanine ligase
LSRTEDPEWQSVGKGLEPGDIFVTLGAGDVSKIGEKFVEKLAKS